jgi:hypothetical protein
MQSDWEASEAKRSQLRVLGGTLGLIAGGLSFFPLTMILFEIYRRAQYWISVLPSEADARTMFFFCVGLYAIWLIAVWWLVRKVPLVLWFLILFPLPAIFLEFFFAKGIEAQWGQKASTLNPIILAPNRAGIETANLRIFNKV